MKKFLYLTQCEGDKLIYPDLLNSDTADILYLSWRVKHPDMLFFPGSSWTEGRNALIYKARELKEQYEFYIFIDDDISFERGSFKEFETHLSTYTPAMATPYLKGFPTNSDLNIHVHTTSFWDPCMNAFHRSVLFDNVILPYECKFDRISWWYSGYINIVLANVFYKNSILQFNNVVIINTKNRPYPRQWLLTRRDKIVVQIRLFLRMSIYPKYLFKNVDKWIFKHVLQLNKFTKDVKSSIHVRVIGLEICSKQDYTICSTQKKMLLRNNPDTKN